MATDLSKITNDPMRFLVALLDNEWETNNTEGNKPCIDKITEYKRYNYGANKDAILIHRNQKQNSKSGLGAGNKDTVNNIKIDIRTIGKGCEDHWLLVVAEVERILDANIINPGDVGVYCELNPDSQQEDVSDKTHQLWRTLIPVQLIQRAKAR